MFYDTDSMTQDSLCIIITVPLVCILHDDALMMGGCQSFTIGTVSSPGLWLPTSYINISCRWVFPPVANLSCSMQLYTQVLLCLFISQYSVASPTRLLGNLLGKCFVWKWLEILSLYCLGNLLGLNNGNNGNTGGGGCRQGYEIVTETTYQTSYQQQCTTEYETVCNGGNSGGGLSTYGNSGGGQASYGSRSKRQSSYGSPSSSSSGYNAPSSGSSFSSGYSAPSGGSSISSGYSAPSGGSSISSGYSAPSSASSGYSAPSGGSSFSSGYSAPSGGSSISSGYGAPSGGSGCSQIPRQNCQSVPVQVPNIQQRRQQRLICEVAGNGGDSRPSYNGRWLMVIQLQCIYS